MRPQPPRYERPPPEPATLADVRDGLARLSRDIAALSEEVKELAALIRPLPKGRRPDSFDLSLHTDHRRGETFSTPEPKSPIEEALWSGGTADTVDTQAAILKSMARGLDNALRDIRAAKMDIQGIAEDPAATKGFNRGRRR